MLPSSSIPCMPLNQLGESSSSAELPILGVPQQHEQSTESTQTVHADKKESMPLLICNVCGKVHILYLLKLHFVMSSIFRIISLSTGKISKQVFAKKFNLIQHQRVHTGQTPPPLPILDDMHHPFWIWLFQASSLSCATNLRAGNDSPRVAI